MKLVKDLLNRDIIERCGNSSSECCARQCISLRSRGKSPWRFAWLWILLVLTIA